jgi:hypothetical protein
MGPVYGGPVYGGPVYGGPVYGGPVYGGPVYYGGYWAPAFHIGTTYHPRYYHHARAPYHCHTSKHKGQAKKTCHRHW